MPTRLSSFSFPTSPIHVCLLSSLEQFYRGSITCPMHFNEAIALSLAARDMRSLLVEVSACYPFPHVACHGGYYG